MTRRISFLSIALLLLTSIYAFANVYGAIRGVVHDPAASPRSGRDGDAESKIVGLGQDRHHRRQRRISNQCRAAGRLFHRRRQPGLRADGAGRHRHLRNRAGRSLSTADRHSERKGHGLGSTRSCAHRLAPRPSHWSISSTSPALPAPTAPTAWP